MTQDVANHLLKLVDRIHAARIAAEKAQTELDSTHNEFRSILASEVSPDVGGSADQQPVPITQPPASPASPSRIPVSWLQRTS